jgi:hypothetical protein
MGSKTPGNRFRPVGSSVLLWAMVASPAFCQQPGGADSALDPLAAKEQMIRDRFQRFQDRIFALSEELSEVEPDNAARLARALERTGELGLPEKLERIVQLLDDPSMLHRAVEEQSTWLADADRVLSILLERDSENEQRREEIERLEAYRKQIGELLEQQHGLRNEAARATATQRMRDQLDQAIQRLDALLGRQGQVAQQSQAAAGADERKQAAGEQDRLAGEADELAEDLKRMAEPPAAQAEEDKELQEAREKTKAAGESTRNAAQSMSQAGQQLQQDAASQAQEQQQSAEELLQKAREQLQAAKEALGEQPPTEQQSEQQKGLAEKTQQLGNQMQQDAESGDSQSKSGQQSQQSAQQNLQQAEKEMNDAAESLEQKKPDEATPSQDRAIEQLEEAKRELEEQLQQMRKEEREETLRDLEARFRDMLARQRPINEATIELDGIGADHFGRSDQLRLADLSAQQLKLSEDAAACLHILDEEGTTVAFPHVVGQLSEDMRTVSERLAQAQVGSVTQTIEREIVETLEQLLDAVKKMQEENEQNQGQSGDPQSGDSPLLPKSAELKLLRASQERVNNRTTAIQTGVAEGREPPQSGHSALKKLATRQLECLEIAKDIRENKP